MDNNTETSFQDLIKAYQREVSNLNYELSLCFDIFGWLDGENAKKNSLRDFTIHVYEACLNDAQLILSRL